MLDGLIPGVVYGKDDDGNVLKVMVSVPIKDLVKELRKQGKSFENTIYRVVVQPTGEQYITTPRQIQFNPSRKLQLLYVICFHFINLFASSFMCL